MANTRSQARVGITDVAARSGVSITTVSHVLSGRRPVAEKTRQRVLQTIEEMGYQPNAVARSMRIQRTETVALIVPNLTDPFYPAVAEGMGELLGPAGYFTLVAMSQDQLETADALVERLIARQVDAIGFAANDDREFRAVAPAIDAGVPVVLFGAHVPRHGADAVTYDDLGAGELATTHLLDQGHERIGFIGGPIDKRSNRLIGYQQTLTTAGQPADPGLIVRTSGGQDGGREGMRQLLRLAEPPTAVICQNDITAIGAMDILREHHCRVPGDVALVGFDDIPAASLVSPALTTVRVPARDEGRAAARLLLQRMNDHAEADTETQDPPQAVTFGAKLVRRESA